MNLDAQTLDRLALRLWLREVADMATTSSRGAANVKTRAQAEEAADVVGILTGDSPFAIRQTVRGILRERGEQPPQTASSRAEWNMATTAAVRSAIFP